MKTIRSYIDDLFGYLFIAFLIWLVSGTVYGKTVSFVNPRVLLVYLPIIALFWPLWFLLLDQFGQFVGWLNATNLHRKPWLW